MPSKRRLHPAAEEFEGVDLGDERRDLRLISLADAAARRSDASFPRIAGSDGALEGAYRFLGNPHVDSEDILEPHGAKVATRAAQLGEVVVVHDTTEFKLSHCDPKEVGYLNTGAPGFFGHVSLAVSADGQRRPLGVIALQTLFRMRRSRRPGGWRRAVSGVSGSDTTKWEDRESKRWQDGIEQSEALLNATPRRVHVADRESDSYQLMARVFDRGARFVFRMRHDRRARSGDSPGAPWSKMSALLATADACLEREVPVSRRSPSTAPRSARTYGRRDQRVARLRFAAAPVELKAPAYLAATTRRTLTVNIVHVYEVDAPPGEEPVDWILVTTEPVDTPDDVARVVDLYRTRWVIEELFQALKSGCIYEQRRLESRHALLNALALFLPIACHLLWLRSRARYAPDAPAAEVASLTQILVLREFAARTISPKPTVREVLLAIAGMGGHLMNNGEPGWATLRRGYEELLLLERGWHRKGRRSL